MTPDQLLALWERALASPKGLAVKSNARDSLKAELYHARRDRGDGRFDKLALVLPVAKDEIWICHKREGVLDD